MDDSREFGEDGMIWDVQGIFGMIFEGKLNGFRCDLDHIWIIFGSYLDHIWIIFDIHVLTFYHILSYFIHLFIRSLQFLRLQLCVSRGDELVSENLRLRTESSELEEAEDASMGRAHGGYAWAAWGRGVDSVDHFCCF